MLGCRVLQCVLLVKIQTRRDAKKYSRKSVSITALVKLQCFDSIRMKFLVELEDVIHTQEDALSFLFQKRLLHNPRCCVSRYDMVLQLLYRYNKFHNIYLYDEWLAYSLNLPHHF